MKTSENVRGRIQIWSKAGFTLIEVLVVVAIIALLISILLPSLKSAREMSRSAVCGSNMRTVATSGSMWMMQEKKERVPAHLGWASHVLKIMKGQTELFRCPSDQKPSVISPVMVSQFREGFKYPTLSTDSGYFRRNPNPNSQGYYKLDMETEADVLGGDADFDDAYVYVKPLNDKVAEVYAQKAGTGRALTLHDWQGRMLEANFSTTRKYQQPLLYGSFGMNLSAALPGLKPWNALVGECTDWSIVREPKLGVTLSNFVPGLKNTSVSQPALRHLQKGNVGFVDTHVELMGRPRMSKDALWFPPRPAGFYNNIQLAN